MKKIYFIFLIIGITISTQVKAQDNIYSIQYSIGSGIGDLKDFNNSVSFRGLSFEYRNMIKPNMGVGFETSYNVFYDREDYATYTRGTESLSGIQYRYTHALPILAAFDYYLKPNNKFNPFVGLGVGTIYTNRDLDMGVFRWQTDVWQFAIRPEIGVIVDIEGWELLLGVKYFNGFDTKNVEGLQYFTLNVGLVF